MSSRTVHNSNPPPENPEEKIDSNYSKERSPVTSLLLAGKEVMVLPLLPETPQPTGNDERSFAQ